MTDHKDHVHVKTSTKTEPDRVWITDHNGVRVDYSHEQFMAAFQALPLPVRMRAAADVQDEATTVCKQRYPNFSDQFAKHWPPDVLRQYAESWEREDAEKAREAQEVEELAKTLFEARWLAERQTVPMEWEGSPYQDEWRSTARALLAAGYRKTDQ